MRGVNSGSRFSLTFLVLGRDIAALEQRLVPSPENRAHDQRELEADKGRWVFQPNSIQDGFRSRDDLFTTD